ncbi:MAG: nucleotidyltransferase family protein [Acidobacteriota bacterium]
MARRKTLTQKQILETLQGQPDVLKGFTVRHIGLFGSFAKGRQTRESDLDFLVEFDEPTFENFIGLVEYLESTFGRRVDVLTPDGVRSIRTRGIGQDIKKSVVYA